MPGNPADLEALAQLLSLGGLSGVTPGLGSAAGKLGKLGGSLLGSDVVRAILVWQIAGQVIGPALQPFMAELQQEAFAEFETRVLSAADAVDAFIRGHLGEQEARDHVHKNGFTDALFDVLAANAGEPPALGQLLEMWRRKIIPEQGSGLDAVSVDQGIRESRTHDKWIPAVKALRYALPSPSEALDALLEGQTDEATAKELWAMWGGHPDYFQLLFDTRGSAPTPMEAAEMARRGIIPWEGEGPQATSFHQAFLEGPWRNKWEPAFRALAEYRPPVRSIVAMLRAGAIDEQRATFYLRQQGASDQTIQEMLAEARHSRTQSARELTTAEVLAMYGDGFVDRARSEAMLARLGWAVSEAQVLLGHADFTRARRQLDQAISRAHTLYIGHKASTDETTRALAAFGVPPAGIDGYLRDWTLERRLNVRLLTPVEVAHAFINKWLSEDQALQELRGLGYSPRDAWISLGYHSKAQLQTPMPPETVPGDELSPAR